MNKILKNFFRISLTISIYLFSLTTSIESKQNFRKDKLISNYFNGIISINNNNSSQAYSYFSKNKDLYSNHENFNIKFVQTLVETGNIDDAFNFLNKIDKKYSNFNEAHIVRGVEAFLKKDYLLSKVYFEKIDTSEDRLGDLEILKFFSSSLATILLQKENYKEYLNSVPQGYGNLKLIIEALTSCHFNSPETEEIFNKLINENQNNFSRYAFFFANYLIENDKYLDAKNLVDDQYLNNRSNLLIKETLINLKNKNYFKIKKNFNCNNANHLLAEFFYITANFASTRDDYFISNFYLKISLFLNKNFHSNRALLAENYYNLKKFKKSETIYKKIQKFKEPYFWYATKRITYVKLIYDNKDNAIEFLEKNFKKIKKPEFEHYYSLANFYKDNFFYEKSVAYYTLALENLPKESYIRYEVLDRRGTSYERLKSWKESDEDLKMSLKLKPDQPYVLNYLAYSWLERNEKLEQATRMLTKANEIKPNDPYIIDSLGWAMFLSGNFIKAEEYLRMALELLPFDPTISDHYADTLWNLKREIQARYFWNQILNLQDVDENLKKKIKKKLIYGLNYKS